MSLLSVNHLTTRFYTRDGITTAVDDVSFSIDAGQVLGLVGESGSGKSVCCYSLLGLLPSPPGKVEAGSALFNGCDLLRMSARQLQAIRGRDIAMIFQDSTTSLTPHMRIGAQLIEPLLVHQRLGVKAAKRRAIAALEEVGITQADERMRSYPYEFSGGMRQRVMIAMALLGEPRLLIADEPTAALDVTVQAQILDLIRRLQRERRLAVIFISHDLGVVSQLADKVLVMQRGRVVEQGLVGQLFGEAQHTYTRKLIAAIPRGAKPIAAQKTAEQPLLRVEDLTVTYGSRSFFHHDAFQVQAVNNLSFKICRGEILGLVGESGSGKTSVGRAIVRLLKPDAGKVWLEGVDLLTLPSKPLRRVRRDVQMIFQDPYASLNPRMTVFDALAEPMLAHQLVKRDQLSAAVNALMDEVGLSHALVRKYPHEFSGGQRQRIAIARALAVQPKLIVADEAVSALDVTIQAQILKLLIRLTQERKLAMLFISHDLAVVRYISDRVMVLRNGEIVEQGSTEVLFAQPKQRYTQLLLSALPNQKIEENKDL